MKRKKILLSGIKVLEYKYLTGLKEAERKKKSIHVLNQEIKGIKARTALVEEAIKIGEGIVFKDLFLEFMLLTKLSFAFKF